MERFCVERKVLYFFLCFMFLINQLKAQDTTYSMQFDIAAEKLDRSEMKTSVLYDRAFPFAKLNKQAYAREELDSIVYDYDYFKQVYLELNVSDYNSAKYEAFNSMTARALEERNLQNKFLIGVIDFDYEYFDTMAFHTGALQIQNGKLIRNFTISTSPFIQDRVSLLSIMSDRVFTGPTKFVLDANSFYLNTSREIVSVQIQFDERNAPIFLKPGDSAIYNFTTLGDLKYTYSITFSNGEVLNSNAIVSIVSSGMEPCIKLDLQTITQFKDYIDTIANAVYSLGYYFNSGCKNRTTSAIYKPIIVLDGFDPNDDRKVGNIYDLFNEGPYHLADSLRADGHDIIIMNFSNGADYIERNALPLIDLLSQLNRATADRITVIGPSMGGLVAKYALSRMEYTNDINKVGLYISFDSPHQGANIPIGDQYFLRFFAEEANNAAAQYGLDKINSPAACQMIMHHYFTKQELITPHSYKGQFDKTLNSLGSAYPIKLRKVGIANGNDIGAEQNVAGKLFSLIKKATALNITVAEGQVYASPPIGRSEVSYCMVASPHGLYMGKEERRYAKAPVTIYPSSLDNAPGGSFNSQEQITKSNGRLNSGFNLYKPNHSFIPSVSALDIKYPDGYLNFRFKIKDNKIVCNGYTPFDAYFISYRNEPHVFISTSTATWVRKEINNINGTVEATTNSTILDNHEVFNYGRNTKDIYSRSLEVRDGAILGINMNSPTGYSNEQYPLPNTKFIVSGNNQSCNPLKIEIENSSKLILGDPNGNVGVFRVSSNSILSLNEGSELIIYNNSSLIIEENNLLKIYPNIRIRLIGENAKIIINGALELEANAIFSFVGNGKIELNSNNINWKESARIKLIGENINHVVLSIKDNKSLSLPFIPNNNNLLEIRNAIVTLNGNHASINSAGATIFQQVKFVGGRGVILNGQANVDISDCEFANTQYGVTAYSTLIEKFNIPSNPLKLESCKFIGNEIAISVYGKGFNLNNIDIADCKKGILADGIEMNSKIYNSNLSADNFQKNYLYSNSGLSYLGNTGSSLLLVNTQLNNFNIGLYSSMSAVNLKCSKFLNSNYYNLWIANNATLNLGTNGILTTGNNSFLVKNGLNNRNICLDNAGNINLKNGQNTFRIANDVQNYFVAGTALNIPNSMDFAKNTWYGDLYSTIQLNPPNQKNFEVKLNVAPSAPRVSNFIVSPVNKLSSGECTSLAKDAFSLEYAPNSKEILSIVNYPTGSFEFILEQILVNLKLDSANLNLESNYNSLLELIQYSKTTTELDLRNYDLCYQIVHEVFNKLFDSKTNSNEKLNLCVQLFTVIDMRIIKLRDSKLVEQLYTTLLDKAQLYTRTREFDLANSVYNAAFEFANTNTKLSNLNHWICYNTTTKDIIQQEFSIYQIDSIYRICEMQFDPMEESNTPKSIQISDTTLLSYQLQPNPSNSIISIEFSAFVNISKIELYDLQGNLIQNNLVNQRISVYDLNISDLPKGVYLLKLITNSDIYNSRIFKY